MMKELDTVNFDSKPQGQILGRIGGKKDNIFEESTQRRPEKYYGAQIVRNHAAYKKFMGYFA